MPLFRYADIVIIRQTTYNICVKQQTKTAVIKSVISLLGIGVAAACGMLIYERAVVYYVTVTAVTLCAAAYNVIDGEKHPQASRVALVLAVLAIVVAACYVTYLSTGLSERFNDFDALKRFILDSGFWGVAVFIGLTVFQVVVLPIPEAVTILLGVAIYGATVSFILSVIGTMIGALISFALGKVFGRRLCNWMFGKENTEKYAKLLGEKGRFVFIIMLLFPAFPDDMLCMIAGITSMSYVYFTVVGLLTRPVMIGIRAYLGSGIIPFDGWGIAVWTAIACLMLVAFILIGAVKRKIESRSRGRR